jgi:hypothetical protein
MISEYERMGMEPALNPFDVLYHNLHGGTKENYETLQSTYSISGQVFELETCQI